MGAEIPTKSETRKFFSWWKVALPIVIGLGVVAWMMIHESKEYDIRRVFADTHFSWRMVVCIIAGVLFMFGRDFGLTWRFRALTDHQLSWRQAYRVDMLCEFTSCVTPSAVGGSSLGMVFLNTEGIEIGRATTLMMTTLIMDELFFVVFCPLIVLFTPANMLFEAGNTGFSHGIQVTFWSVYAVLFVWTSILFLGIIWKPLWIRKLIMKIFSWRMLRRWQTSAVNLADNMLATSKALRLKPFRFWVEIFCATALSWTSRYLVVNALFFGFVPGADHNQWVILARQFVIWVVLIVSPTPGGAGLSEWIFSQYYGDMVTSMGMSLILAILWRLISYYLYLAIGAFVLPGWLRQAFDKIHGDSHKQNKEITHKE